MRRPVLNTELVLEAPERVADGGGGASLNWVPMGTLWGEVRPSSARERLLGGRMASKVTHRILIRHAPEGSPRRPRADCRFRSGSRVFAIKGMAPAGIRGDYLTCWAEEGVFV